MGCLNASSVLSHLLALFPINLYGNSLRVSTFHCFTLMVRMLGPHLHRNSPFPTISFSFGGVFFENALLLFHYYFFLRLSLILGLYFLKSAVERGLEFGLQKLC
jgi:hypothetical protein